MDNKYLHPKFTIEEKNRHNEYESIDDDDDDLRLKFENRA